MRWLYTVPLRLRSLFSRNRVEEELAEEFQYHLDQQIEQNIAAGMDPGPARTAAKHAMARLEHHKERCRDARRVTFFDHLAQDLRYAARMIRKAPGFAVVAVLSLALGIGVNTAVFSLLNAILMTKLPVHDPDKLYQLIATHRTYVKNAFSWSNYEKVRSSFDILEDVAIWVHKDWNLEADQSQARVHGALASGNFYRFMGVKPVIGRLIEPYDDTFADSSVVVLGYGFWQRQFLGDSAVIGKVVKVEGAPFTVIGVTPPEFGGAEIDYPRDVTLPIHAIKRYDPQDRTLENPGAYVFSALVRLKPGVTADSARPVLRDLWPRLDEGEGLIAADHWRPKLDLAPGSFGVSKVRYDFSQPLLIVMGLVALVLLMMCANLASLLLARALARRKEVAVRLALGANRSRLMRQTLTEALLLALMGGTAGLVLAGWITRLILLFLPPEESGFLAFHLDLRMLAFSAALTLGTALLFGTLPAFQAVRVPLSVVMNEAGRTPGAGRRARLSRAVVGAQVSVSLVLVIGSLLFARSLNNISKANLGFKRDGLLLMELNPSRAGIRGEQSDVLYKQILDQLNNTPGIASATLSRVTPLSGSQWWDSTSVPGYTPADDEMTTVYLNQVAPQYFTTLGIPIREGREFTAADDKNSRRVAIVNESFARHFFQGKSVLGQVFSNAYGIKFPDNPRTEIFRNLEIVGVAENTKYSDPHEAQKDLVYIASYQSGLVGITGAVEIRLREGVKPEEATPQIRKLVNGLARGLDVGIRPYNSVFDGMLRRDRMVAVLSAVFGLLGVMLACIGVYGVMSRMVVSRMGEIGIRVTLGAGRRQVEWMILRETLLLLSAGAAVGIPLAILSGRFASGLLYDLKPANPWVFAASLALMAAVSAASAWFPARRAARIDPMVALRRN